MWPGTDIPACSKSHRGGGRTHTMERTGLFIILFTLKGNIYVFGGDVVPKGTETGRLIGAFFLSVIMAH